jgi:phospholipid transport system substrate-binding protein
MFRHFMIGVCLLGLMGIVPAHTAGAAEAATPAQVVEKFHGRLIDNMKTGKDLGYDGRVAKLEPVVKETFDLTNMARVSTGAAWQKMSEADRAAIVAAFSKWTIANYAGNFKVWGGEAFVTRDQAPADGKGNVMVNTRLELKGQPPVLFNYRLHKIGDAWTIFDIYLDGAISQLAMRRGEFAGVLAKGTAADLVNHMERLAAAAKAAAG